MPSISQHPLIQWLQSHHFKVIFFSCWLATLAVVFVLSISAPGLVVLGVLLAIGVGLAIFRSLPIGVCLLLLLSVFPGLITSNISTIKGLRVFNLLFLMTWGILMIEMFVFERSQFRLAKSSLNRPILVVWLLFWAWDYLHGYMVGINPDFKDFIDAAFKPLQFISIYYLVLFTTVRKHFSQIYLYVILITIMLAGLLFQHSIGNAMQAGASFHDARDMGFYEPNEFGVYAAYMMVFCVVMFSGVRSWWARALVLTALVCAGAGMLLSGSRGGVASVLLSLPICFWYMKPKQRLVWGLLLTVFAFFVFFGTHDRETALSRFQNTFVESLNRNNSVDLEKFSSGRISRIVDALALVAEKPAILIFGYQYTGGPQRYLNPHNFYVDSLFRGGILGLLAVIWLAWRAFGYFRQTMVRFQADPYVRAWAHGSLAALFSLYLNGIWMHSFLGNYTTAPLMGMLAVSVALADSEHCPTVSKTTP